MRTTIKHMLGFTMIELLVVIAVIGVLSVAVLSAINPIEQINKGKDTRSRSDAAELINAIDRYYSTQEEYPWNTTGTGWSGSGSAGTVYWYSGVGAAGADTNLAWINNLVMTEEVKPGFATRVVNDNKLYVYKPAGANQTMYACFVPTSKGFDLEARKACGSGADPVKSANFCGSGVAGAGSYLICLP
jgi:prepilin-type N-terminal cleavage/methylation domain-containing protein